MDCVSSRCNHIVPYVGVHLDAIEYETWVNFQKAKPKPCEEPEEVAGKCPHCCEEIKKKKESVAMGFYLVSRYKLLFEISLQ